MNSLMTYNLIIIYFQPKRTRWELNKPNRIITKFLKFKTGYLSNGSHILKIKILPSRATLQYIHIRITLIC